MSLIFNVEVSGDIQCRLSHCMHFMSIRNIAIVIVIANYIAPLKERQYVNYLTQNYSYLSLHRKSCVSNQQIVEFSAVSL